MFLVLISVFNDLNFVVVRFSRREFNEFRPLHYCERCHVGKVSISYFLVLTPIIMGCYRVTCIVLLLTTKCNLSKHDRQS